MNKSLATFMMMAAVVIIMVTLLFGVAYDSLAQKSNHNEEMLKTVHQVKIK